MQDPISTLKLYPRKSNNLVTTSVNTQVHIAKELVDYTLGFELSEDVYFDSATWDYSRYNWLCGRGNNTGFPSGMVAPGSTGNYFQCNWKNGGFSAVSMESKPAGWYRVTMIVTTTTHQQKVQNLSTGEIFSGTAELNGTSTIGESVAFTLFSYGIDGATGAYGSVGMNVSNVKITRNGATIFHLPLSEGVGDKVTDVCNSSQYQITFINPALTWAKLSNYFHHNFRYGFTLYQKSGSADLYIPNTSSQTEISITPPSGYTKIGNYKNCKEQFNNCESKFKLDNLSLPIADITISGADIADFNKTLAYMGNYPSTTSPYWKYTASITEKDIYCVSWFGRWFLFIGQIDENITNAQYYGNTYNLAHPDLETIWRFYSKLGDATIIITKETASVPNLYISDPDRILFNEDGTGKEFSIIDLYVTIFDLIKNRGFMYINDESIKNFMLYKTDKGIDTPEDLKIWKYVEK